MSLTVDVLNIKGEKIDTMELPESVFDVKASSALIHEVVTAYLANLRHGTHSTKTRGEVSGGGLKPWKQKHTGRARSGSIRSPLWRHGGITFGPKPHKGYHQPISTAKRHLVLKAVLSDYLKNGKMRVVDSFKIAEPKTKRVLEIAKNLRLPRKSVVVMDQIDESITRASRNLPSLRVCRAKDLNCHSALLAKELLFTRSALQEITKRLQNGASVETPSGN